VTIKELPIGILPKAEYDQWYEMTVGETMKMIEKI
jgi:hypothetical protein